MKRHPLMPFFLCLVLFSFGCATTRITGPGAPQAPTTPSKTARVVDTFEGTASWYGPEFHGKKTASGEIFDMTDLTAAHNTLPLGTVCMVTNLRNNKSVTVRINDRGPFVKERVIDLSYAAATTVGMIDTGTAPVRVEVLAEGDYPTPETTPITPPKIVETPIDITGPSDASTPPETAAPPTAVAELPYTVQVGAFSSQANAQTLYDTLAGKYEDVAIDKFSTSETTYWRVRVGKFATKEEAQAKGAQLKEEGYAVFITAR